MSVKNPEEQLKQKMVPSIELEKPRMLVKKIS